MSAAAIFNGFGKYETNANGQKGITLKFAGIEFWLPYDEVTYIPDFTMREVDHDKSTADKEEESFLTYLGFVLSGGRIAEELLETQIPIPNSKTGIILIANSKEKRLNDYVTVNAGWTLEGVQLTTEIQRLQPTEMEVAEAHRLAEDYKVEVIQQYFQSKRERMAGGNGPVSPKGLVKVFMEELGVKDIDDVTKQLDSKPAAGMVSLETIKALQAVLATPTVQTVASPTLTAGPDIGQRQVKITTEKKSAESIV